jgi:hypothetical protein
MAKKRKKRRHPQRPSRPATQAGAAAAEARRSAEAPTEADRSPSKRAERKEEARRERERRIRQVKRRRRTRRLIRWGVVVVVAGGIAGGVYLSGQEDRERQARAAALASELNCTEVEEQGAAQLNEHVEPFAQGESGVPAFGGNHTPGALPADPKVYQQQPPEETAIHNLEHGYVIVYYSDEDENALDDEIVSALEDMVSDQTEVLMSPYAGLSEPVHFLAWGARQACDPPADSDPEDIVFLAEAFIDEWKNGQFAPEAPAA